MLLAYQALCTLNNFQYDYAQVNAIKKLDELSQKIYQQESRTWLSKRLNKSNSISGLYFYGRVGRGKTMLMDLFFQNLAITSKQRIHFPIGAHQGDRRPVTRRVGQYHRRCTGRLACAGSD